MTRLLIYLFPALMDVILGSVFFVNTVRIAELPDSSATAAAMVVPIWALTYMIACLIIGPRNNERNTAPMLILGCLGQVACAAAFVMFPEPGAIYWLMPAQAVATALFFVPFQLFMKTVEGGRSQGVVRSTALYTFSWSAGIACGPFVAGFLMAGGGWRWCHGLNAAIALVTAVGILCFKHLARQSESASTEPQSDLVGGDEYASMPDLAWLGWVGSGVGFAAIACIRGVFPTTGALLNIPQPQQGAVLAIMAGSHALFALTLLRSHTWMYRGKPIALFGLFGVAGLVLFSVAQSVGVFYAAAACFGVYSATFSFYFVFHSLVHPNRAGRYVAVNESVVGICSIIGPFAGGQIADRVHLFNLSWPYLAAAVMVVCAVAFQAVVHRRDAEAVRRLG